MSSRRATVTTAAAPEKSKQHRSEKTKRESRPKRSKSVGERPAKSKKLPDSTKLAETGKAEAGVLPQLKKSTDLVVDNDDDMVCSESAAESEGDFSETQKEAMQKVMATLPSLPAMPGLDKPATLLSNEIPVFAPPPNTSVTSAADEGTIGEIVLATSSSASTAPSAALPEKGLEMDSYAKAEAMMRMFPSKPSSSTAPAAQTAGVALEQLSQFVNAGRNAHWELQFSRAQNCHWGSPPKKLMLLCARQVDFLSLYGLPSTGYSYWQTLDER